VIDGGVELGFSPAMAATGVLQDGAAKGSEGGAGSLQEVDVVLMALLVVAKRPCIGRSTRSRAAAVLGVHRSCGEWC
jgi:hypothetical protein